MRRPYGLGLWACLPLLAGLYLPFIGGGLLTDDFGHILRLTTQIDDVARLVDTSDTYGFYRPVTQSSIALELAVHGQRFARFRALNVLLHAGVLALAFVVARLVLDSSLAAGLAALAFALTPKAHPIAVLWISARGELLMALFAFAAVASWIVWTRGGRSIWLAASGLAFALSLTSKETAALLPLLLIVTPRPERTLTSRAVALIGLFAVATAIVTWRAHTGALTPFSGNEHYDLMSPLTVWIRNAVNYSGRMFVAPLALVAVVALAVLPQAGLKTRLYGDGPKTRLYGMSAVLFALAWVVVFLAPLLPIRLRSELYLYLPVFGLCLLAGWIAAALIHRIDSRRAVTIAIAVYAIAFIGYQVSRAQSIHQDLVFSERLVDALRNTPHLAGRDGQMFLMPSDAATERFLQRAVGEWLFLAVYHARGSSQLLGRVAYAGKGFITPGLRLTCAYRQDEGLVIISPAP